MHFAKIGHNIANVFFNMSSYVYYMIRLSQMSLLSRGMDTIRASITAATHVNEVYTPNLQIYFSFQYIADATFV